MLKSKHYTGKLIFLKNHASIVYLLLFLLDFQLKIIFYILKKFNLRFLFSLYSFILNRCGNYLNFGD